MKAVSEKESRALILEMVKEYSRNFHNPLSTFHDTKKITYAGRVFNEMEVSNLVETALDFWLTTGRFAEEFEKRFSDFLKVKYCSLVNSGSSANLLAFMALTSSKLGERKIRPGDEVITVACGFPTTVAPIIQYGAIPVFVDISLPTYNIDVSAMQGALSKKTKAVMVAHTLGNPFDLKAVRSFCDTNDLWLIEDNCDALGSKYYWNAEWRFTGTIGHIGTSSFYPPHHITMGEGGAVYTNDAQLFKIINSMRDWGRDCWCPSGKDDTCGHRFSQQFGELPQGYDHKYVYSHFGYNLKLTEMQAAIGCAQLEKLPFFINKRRDNWQKIKEGITSANNWFIMPEPSENSIPSWFGFLLSVRKEAPFTRNDAIRYLEARGIQTRMLFAGNLIKHPCFDELRVNGTGYRQIGDLPNTNYVLDHTFWIGVYPGLTQEMINYMIESINSIGDSRL